MGQVSITRTDGGIKEGLIRALQLIGGLERYICHQDVVMIKPNINGTEDVTNLELVEGLIQLLIQFPVQKVIIAESTFGNEQMTEMCFKKSGYLDLANRYGIELINLNRSESVDVAVNTPLVATTLKIAQEVFAVDKIINVPVMKVHYATGVTLALKNLKGLLVRQEKRHFHDIGLDDAIVDLNRMIKPALNIVDCISCMERMGPKGGDMIRLNLLIAGENSGEVDYIGSQLMGYELDEVEHVQTFIAEHHIHPGDIQVMGEKLAEVTHPFKKVELEGKIPEAFHIHTKDACSSCMNAFLLSCQLLEPQNFPETDIYMGTIDNSVVGEQNLKIAFGNCCSKSLSSAKKVKGCPPFPYELKRVLEEVQ